MMQDINQRLLCTWALAFGMALWCPALGIQIGLIFLQPAELLVLFGSPLILVFFPQLTFYSGLTIALLSLSVLASWFVVGGHQLVLAWTFIFAVPATVLLALTLAGHNGRKWILVGFCIGGFANLVLFLLQLAIGAEALDFRNNLSFRLPPHFGRGFGLFPEVSTFAAHSTLLFAICLTICLHPNSTAQIKVWCRWGVGFILIALMFTRSTSVIILFPLLTLVAIWSSRRLTLNTVLLVLLIGILGSVLLTVFVTTFFVDRLETSSANRSAAMRLASILGGLTPFFRGEAFGVGVGNNDLVSYRSYEVARDFGLDFGRLPDGVNSHIFTRLFEEGYLAAFQISLSVLALAKAKPRVCRDPSSAAAFVLAVGSLVLATMVIGYRSIYTNWIWLAAACAYGVLNVSPGKKSATAA